MFILYSVLYTGNVELLNAIYHSTTGPHKTWNLHIIRCLQHRRCPYLALCLGRRLATMKYYKPLKDETPLESDFRDEDRRPNRLRIETERKDSGGEDCDSTRVGAILDLLSSKNSDFNANFNLTNGALNVLSKDVSQALFIKARKLLNPGIFFRWVIHLYAERKMIVFFGIHFVSTMIIWGTF